MKQPRLLAGNLVLLATSLFFGGGYGQNASPLIDVHPDQRELDTDLHVHPTASPSIYPMARYVKIMQNNTLEQLQMFEVQVFSNGSNVAVGMPTDQSSTLVDEFGVAHISSMAVDDDMVTFSSTDCSDPWWIVDLGCLMPIEYVDIFNRWCDDPSDGPGCLCQLSHATVQLLDEQQNVVDSENTGDTCGVTESIHFLTTDMPTASPNCPPTENPTLAPVTEEPTASPTDSPTVSPSLSPSFLPTTSPTFSPTFAVTDPPLLSCTYPMARYVKIEQTTLEQLQMFEVQVISSGVNVASGMPADQSSTLVDAYGVHLAANAVDNDLTTYSHTDCSDPWWIVDLGMLLPIERIHIFNRWCDDPSDGPGCLCKMTNATLLLFDETYAVSKMEMIGDTCGVEELVYNFCETEAPTLSPTFSPTLEVTDPSGLSCQSYPEARFVKIESTTMEQLQMFEVHVISSGTNIALGKPADQSSTLVDAYGAHVATNAADGDFLTYSHTDCSDPWWMIDLGAMYPIQTITIFNRWCDDPSDGPGCLCLMTNATLSLLDDADTVVEMEMIGDTCGIDELTYHFCNDAPTASPNCSPTENPTLAPVTDEPTASPTDSPTESPSLSPSVSPTDSPTVSPSDSPTVSPSLSPSFLPTTSPTFSPTFAVTDPPLLSCTYPMARYVKIEQTTLEQLQMFEVQVISSGVNVASGMPADQSSTLVDAYGVHLAANAVDNDLTTYSHTDCSDPWWIVDLGMLLPIERIHIFNRWCDDPSDGPGCLCKMTNATLLLFDETYAVSKMEMIGDTCGVEELVYNFCETEAPTLSPTFSPTLEVTDPSGLSCQSYPEARFVKIESTTMEQLQMFEVHVISSGTNIALGKPADQSSTLVDAYGAHVATNAADGDFLTYSHTDCSDPWWMIDLGAMYPIQTITIFNRWCDDPSDGPGCLCLMTNATLSLLDDADTVVEMEMIGDTCGIDELTYHFCNDAPTASPNCSPTENPTLAPVTDEPTVSPTDSPTESPSLSPSVSPTVSPTFSPTIEVTDPAGFVCTSFPMARYVKILQNTTEEQLKLFEVLVMSSGMNMALGQPTNQSSTLVDSIARLSSYAVDGDIATYSHTDCDDPWWIVDLGVLVPVERVTILNPCCDEHHHDDEADCLCHLSNATILLLDEHKSVIDTKPMGNTCGFDDLHYDFCEETTASPNCSPTSNPTQPPVTDAPVSTPGTVSPTKSPSQSPTTVSPTKSPTQSPVTASPTKGPTQSPTLPLATTSPTYSPTYDFIPDSFDNSQANPSPSSSPVVISVPSSMSLDNFVVPSTQEEYDAVVGVLEATLEQTIESLLTEGQNLSEISVTSIGGQTGVVRRRFLESTEVNYVMTLEENCTENCHSSASNLYDQVKTGLTDSVESGAFVSSLKNNAAANGNASSLANVAVQAPVFENYSIPTPSPTLKPTKSPTNPPTLRPTTAPTAHQANNLPAPTSPNSSGKMSGSVIFTILSAAALYLCI